VHYNTKEKSNLKDKKKVFIFGPQTQSSEPTEPPKIIENNPTETSNPLPTTKPEPKQWLPSKPWVTKKKLGPIWVQKQLNNYRTFYLFQSIYLLFLLNFFGSFVYNFFIILVVNNPKTTSFFEEKVKKKYGNSFNYILITGCFLIYKGYQLVNLFKKKRFNSYFNHILLNLGILLSLYSALHLINGILFGEVFEQLVDKEMELARPTCSNATGNNTSLNNGANGVKVQPNTINKWIFNLQNIIIILTIANGLWLLVDSLIYPKISIKVPKNNYFNPLKEEMPVEPNLFKLFKQMNNLHFNSEKGPDVIDTDVIEY
jgi:hypothetical protein